MLEHRTPERTYPLADIDVGEDRAEPSLEKQFAPLRTNPEFAEERARLDAELEAEPDKTLAFVAEMDMEAPSLAAGEHSSTPVRCTPTWSARSRAGARSAA